jgi:hypothetical protein
MVDLQPEISMAAAVAEQVVLTLVHAAEKNWMDRILLPAAVAAAVAVEQDQVQEQVEQALEEFLV